MRNFKITVNGVTYDVGVEEVARDGSTVYSAPVTPIHTENKAVAETKKPAPVAVSSSGFQLKSPMPGTIWEVKVKVGDTVTKDQCGVILEAMKMENEIFIPVEGKITSVNVSKGSAVNTGDILLTVE